MSQHDSLINLSFAKPGAFLSGAKDLDSDVLAMPAASPYLAEAAFADDIYQLDLTGDWPLYEKWKT